jgi:hypothetical protein
VTKQHHTKAERELRRAAEHISHRIVSQERWGYVVYRSYPPRHAVSPRFMTVSEASEWLWENMEEGKEYRREYDALNEKAYVAAAMKGGLSEAEALADYFQDGAA